MQATHSVTDATCPRGRQALARVALALALCAGLVLPSAWARDSDDHDRARAALQAGEVLPLSQVIERLQRTHPGQILELELDREDGRWIYEVKLLQADGTLLKLELDARTADILKAKRKDDRDRSSGRARR